MSFTDGMSKTVGVRQNNCGWARMVREDRREEAVARNKAYHARGRVPAREMKSSDELRLLTEIFTEENR